MNTLPRKKRRPPKRWLLLLAALAVLCVTGAALLLVEASPTVTSPESVVTYGEIHAHTQEDIRALTVTQQGKAPWTLLQDENGACTLSGAEGSPLDESLVKSLLMVASVVSYEKILTDDPADYAGRLADFGLESPLLTVCVTYADGLTATMRIGAQVSGSDMAYVYMLLDGDDRLFALDKGTFDALNIDASLLHAVVQPTLHKARIDSITLTGPSGQTHAAWTLQGDITDADAASQWLMTAPWRYPADADMLDSLRENIAGLRLGAYVCEATQENLAAYGFTEPRFVLDVHQAGGMTNSINDNGEVEVITWPESTFTLTVGSKKNDNVDYVLVDGAIYTASHFTLDVFMSLTPLDTLSRYPVTVAAAVLDEMTVTSGGETTVYRLSRSTEITDAETGASTTVTTVTRNGQEISCSAFEAAYIRLETVRISGLLPDGWESAEAPHTVFTLKNTTGLTQTIALTSFDALHDAVLVNGHAVFYLIKNGMQFTLAAE